MFLKKAHRSIGSVILILFSIYNSYSQSLPTSYYGIWDRGDGIQDYSDPKTSFVLGIETTSLWEDIQPTGPNSWDFSYFQHELDQAVANDKLIRFSVNVGPESPLWLFNYGVPLVHVLSNAPKNDNYANRYPYYLDADYKTYYFAMIEQFALFLRNQPQEKFNHIAFVQVKTGSTGDEEAYKGDAIIGAINNNIDYTISKTVWENFRIECFAKFKQYFNDVSTRKIVLTFNNIDPITEPDAYNWVMNTMDPAVGFGMKGGAFNRGHHLSDEQTYKEQWTPYLINPHQDAVNTQGLKLFAASEMDQSWTKGYFAKNYEIGFYWAALGGLNTGVSCTNVSASAMQYALANPGIIETFKMYNRYAQQVYPQTATTAFSILHEGLNSADTQKFPTDTYGSPANQSNVTRYQNICNSTKYYNRGARMDEPLLATYGQVWQRDKQMGYNDAGWEIAEGNIERFMTQINPDDTSIGLFRVRGPLTASSSKYDRFARSFENSTGRNTMYFKLDSQLQTSNKDLKFVITWLDKTAGSTWAFKYRNASGLQSVPFTGSGTNEWRTDVITLSDAIINQGGTLGSDFMLVNTDTVDDIFNGIEMNILQAQTINFNALPIKKVGDADFYPGGTSNSRELITYTSSNTNVATIVNNKIHIVGTGSCTITASLAGNNYYYAAPSVSQHFSVVVETQTTITTSGTWTCPPGINKIKVEAWGGGGGGGGTYLAGFAGGGAGGSYVINDSVTVNPSSSYSVTIGAGGALSNSGGADGYNGSNTTFASATPVMANGGAGGKGTTTAGQLGVGGTNTLGGSGGTVTIGLAGFTGSSGSSGAGGNGAGTLGGAGAVSTTSVGNGLAGTSPGGGGAGAYGATSGSNKGGAGGAGQVTITYSVGVPNTPTIGTATVSGVSGQATISFTAPTFNGNAVITSYTATSSPGGITATVTQSGSGSITLNGLTNGITYTFTVRATNSVGQSAESAASNQVAPGIFTTWNGSSWSNRAPDSNTEAIINGAYSTGINGAISAKKLIVNAAKSLTISSVTNVTVQNEVINNGTLTIENNANLIQPTGSTYSGTGTATVKRNSNSLYRLDYTLWSSPVTGTQTLAQFSPLTSQSPSRFYTYDPQNNVYTSVASPTTTTFTAGNSYLIRMPNQDAVAGYNDGTTAIPFTGVFTGVPNNGNVVLSGLTAGQYVAVGNPYPSTISAASFLSGNAGVGSTLYFWRKTNNSAATSYATWTSAGSVANTGGDPNGIVPNGTIQVGQGFIVSTGTATALTFTNAMREAAPTSTQILKMANNNEKSRLWLNLSSPTGGINQMMVAYMDGSSIDIDTADGKYINDAPTALTSKINDEEYIIQGRPVFDASDVVPLNFKTDKAGEFKIAIDHTDGVFAAGQDIYLVDSKTGAETNLQTDAYTFTAAAGLDNSRFTLKYQTSTKAALLSNSQEGVLVFCDKGYISVSSLSQAISEIKVFDIQGKQIASQKEVNAYSTTIENVTAKNQVLIVQVKTADNKVVKTKILN